MTDKPEHDRLAMTAAALGLSVSDLLLRLRADNSLTRSTADGEPDNLEVGAGKETDAAE